MLDYDAHPHIVDAIIDFAIADTLAQRSRVAHALRPVSRWVCDRVDAALFAHIEIDQFSRQDKRINVEGAGRRPLPGFRLRGYEATLDANLEPVPEASDLDAPLSPLRLLRHARVVDFRAKISEKDGALLFPALRDHQLTAVRKLYLDQAPLSCRQTSAPTFPCDMSVRSLTTLEVFNLAYDLEELEPTAHTHAMTFWLPSEINVSNAEPAFSSFRTSLELVIRFRPKYGRFESIEPAKRPGLGLLDGLVGCLVERAVNPIKLTLVGAEAEGLRQTLFGLPDEPFNAHRLKEHIVDAIWSEVEKRAHFERVAAPQLLARVPDIRCRDATREMVEASVSVVTVDERIEQIGQEAFELETCNF